MRSIWVRVACDVTDFFGTLCLTTSARIVFLSKELNNMMGTIPTENGLLTTLTFFDLDYNFLEGTFPTELCNLENLQWLLLKDNSIEGEIPS